MALAYDPLVLFASIPHPVFKLAVALRHLLNDDVRAARQVLVRGGFDEDGPTNLEFAGRHGAPSRKSEHSNPISSELMKSKEESHGMV